MPGIKIDTPAVDRAGAGGPVDAVEAGQSYPGMASDPVVDPSVREVRISLSLRSSHQPAIVLDAVGGVDPNKMWRFFEGQYSLP